MLVITSNPVDMATVSRPGCQRDRPDLGIDAEPPTPTLENPIASLSTPDMSYDANPSHTQPRQGQEAPSEQVVSGSRLPDSARDSDNRAGTQPSGRTQHARQFDRVSQSTKDSGIGSVVGSGRNLVHGQRPPPSSGQQTEGLAEEISSVQRQISNKLDKDEDYSSWGSMPSASCSSMPSIDWDAELAKCREHMPPDIKIGYYDVMILYTEDDRDEAEIFRQHLINEIELECGETVKAVLYDCHEMTALAGSKIRHLEYSLQRCTYVFVYLTKRFIQDKWMEFSSEECLMKAIYDEEKRWCVVPVYTKKRGDGGFRVPMGLNSLKGINYYNNDQFYRNGVSRLIGDKVYVRKLAEERHKQVQRMWIGQYKRDKLKQEEEVRRLQRREEQKIQERREELAKETENLVATGQLGDNTADFLFQQFGIQVPGSMMKAPPSLQHSSSTGSMQYDPEKPMRDQAPAVLEYFRQLAEQNQAQAKRSFSQEDLPNWFQQMSIPPAFASWQAANVNADSHRSFPSHMSPIPEGSNVTADGGERSADARSGQPFKGGNYVRPEQRGVSPLSPEAFAALPPHQQQNLMLFALQGQFTAPARPEDSVQRTVEQHQQRLLHHQTVQRQQQQLLRTESDYQGRGPAPLLGDPRGPDRLPGETDQGHSGGLQSLQTGNVPDFRGMGYSSQSIPSVGSLVGGSSVPVSGGPESSSVVGHCITPSQPVSFSADNPSSNSPPQSLEKSADLSPPGVRPGIPCLPTFASINSSSPVDVDCGSVPATSLQKTTGTAGGVSAKLLEQGRQLGESEGDKGDNPVQTVVKEVHHHHHHHKKVYNVYEAGIVQFGERNTVNEGGDGGIAENTVQKKDSDSDPDDAEEEEDTDPKGHRSKKSSPSKKSSTSKDMKDVEYRLCHEGDGSESPGTEHLDVRDDDSPVSDLSARGESSSPRCHSNVGSSVGIDAGLTSAMEMEQDRRHRMPTGEPELGPQKFKAAETVAEVVQEEKVVVSAGVQTSLRDRPLSHDPELMQDSHISVAPGSAHAVCLPASNKNNMPKKSRPIVLPNSAKNASPVSPMAGIKPTPVAKVAAVRPTVKRGSDSPGAVDEQTNLKTAVPSDVTCVKTVVQSEETCVKTLAVSATQQEEDADEEQTFVKQVPEEEVPVTYLSRGGGNRGCSVDLVDRITRVSLAPQTDSVLILPTTVNMSRSSTTTTSAQSNSASQEGQSSPGAGANFQGSFSAPQQTYFNRALFQGAVMPDSPCSPNSLSASSGSYPGVQPVAVGDDPLSQEPRSEGFPTAAASTRGRESQGAPLSGNDEELEYDFMEDLAGNRTQLPGCGTKKGGRGRSRGRGNSNRGDGSDKCTLS